MEFSKNQYNLCKRMREGFCEDETPEVAFQCLSLSFSIVLSHNKTMCLGFQVFL